MASRTPSRSRQPRSRPSSPSFRRILVGVDFSRPSRAALAQAIQLGRLSGAAIEVVYVTEPFHPALPFSPRNRAAAARLWSRVRTESQARLEDLVAGTPKDVEVHTQVLSGQPDVEILRQAQRRKADLIVLAARGHSSLEYLLVGSTVDRVVRRSQVPVLVVPSPARGRRARDAT